MYDTRTRRAHIIYYTDAAACVSVIRRPVRHLLLHFA